MSKCSRRPGREAIKEQRKARKQEQRALRQQQQAQGLRPPLCLSLPNRKCPYQTAAEERGARLGAVTGQVKVFRAVMPGLLKLRNTKVTNMSTVSLMIGRPCAAIII